MIRSRQVFALKAKTRARKAQLARCWLVGGALLMKLYIKNLDGTTKPRILSQVHQDYFKY